jgi:hypothetical protein
MINRSESDHSEGKWIKFVIVGKKPKTMVWNVIAKQDATVLGYIAWFARWRGYAFFPEPNLVFEKTCLSDIAGFIAYQNTEHRKRRNSI